MNMPAVVKSRNHWELLILLAKLYKDQNILIPRTVGDALKYMSNGKEEYSPYSGGCALCRVYLADSCKDCPIPDKCKSDGSMWSRAVNATAWNDFIDHAQILLNYLNELIKKVPTCCVTCAKVLTCDNKCGESGCEVCQSCEDYVCQKTSI